MNPTQLLQSLYMLLTNQKTGNNLISPVRTATGGNDLSNQALLNYYKYEDPQLPNQQVSPTPTMPQQVLSTQVIPTMPQTSKDPFADFITTKMNTPYANLIAQSAMQNGIPPALLASLLFSEHGFQTTGNNTNYDSSGKPLSTDRGIAQINNIAHPEVSDAQANDPSFAVPWAAKTLANHIRNLGYQRGIVAYNAGEGGARSIANPQQHPYYKKVVSGMSSQLKQQLGL